MDKYNGKKFWTEDGDVTISFDEYGNKVVKQNFHMTSSYLKYLKQQEEIKKQKEIETLKNCLEYQYKTYGEVDKYDFQRYCSMIGIKVQ